MDEFKIGDRVRVKATGRTGVVEQINCYRRGNRFDFCADVKYHVPFVELGATCVGATTDWKNLEHDTSEAKFNVGDEVRIKSGRHANKVGYIDSIVTYVGISGISHTDVVVNCVVVSLSCLEHYPSVESRLSALESSEKSTAAAIGALRRDVDNLSTPRHMQSTVDGFTYSEIFEQAAKYREGLTAIGILTSKLNNGPWDKYRTYDVGWKCGYEAAMVIYRRWLETLGQLPNG